MTTTRSLLRLRPFVKPFWGYITASALLAIPLSAIRLGPAPIVKYLLDDLLTRKDSSQIIYLPIALISLYCLNFIIRFLHYYLLRIAIVRVNESIKNHLFGHLLGLSADYFTSQTTGSLISRTGSDPQSIDSGLASINILIREPITLVFLFGYALNLNWRLTLITLLVIPPLGWVFSRTGKNLKRYLSRIAEVNGELFSTLEESFTGIRVIKTFGLKGYMQKKFAEKNSQYARLLLKTSLLEEASHPLVELLTAFALSPIVYYGGMQVLDARMTAGELFGFFTAFAMMMNPIRSMNDVNLKLHQAAAACDRIFHVFEWKSNLHESPKPLPFPEIQEGLSLKDVSFAYPDRPDRNVLEKVSFSVPKGHAIAIVGASGAGKSSLVSLLPRIFDVSSGSIQIDGIDIREFCLHDLRRHIAVVSQDVFLFNDTIEENIRCGFLEASASDIQRAAERAHATDFIDRLPQKFGTFIGDRGQLLSGGERQRLSIARAFLREAPLLILDEATSSLDSTSERAVQVALEELMRNRTTLMIAHRLSTIRHADCILVLKDGRIVEQGSHEDLIRLGGEYAQFHEAPPSA